MRKTLLFTLMILSLLISACTITIAEGKLVRGSGNLVSEERQHSGFTGIELAGSADVEVSFGETESVVVEAEDNIISLIETDVRGSTLVIRTKPNTTIASSLPVRVLVTMKELKAVSLPGSGFITIDGLDAERVEFELPGSGTINASGVVDELQVSLPGSGELECQDLQARTAEVKLGGSGIVKVFASQGLDAAISGSGTIQYSGNPANVKEKVTGSGEVVAVK